jgi:aspartokinase/homoserine dehydrogenase 1
MKDWNVHKFGGTSLASADMFRRVADIIQQEKRREGKTAVVVSAMSTVTDGLLHAVQLAEARDDGYRASLSSIKTLYTKTANELLSPASAEALESVLENDCGDISEVLRAVFLCRNASDSTRELVSGYGELWSAQVLGAYLNQVIGSSAWLDARDVLVVSGGSSDPVVVYEASRNKLKSWCLDSDSDIVVVTGFIASTPDGVPTTLGRNGSDYSASIFGCLLDARAITIWTDVDGVLSADPRLVPEAVVLDDLSYDEATELAYFGAKVLHPRTMTPAVQKAIPIYIRNTLKPSHPGTIIRTKSSASSIVKGFASIDNISVINVEGNGFIGVPGIAQRIFGSLKDVNVSVIMISQASSEHSICLAVQDAQAHLAKDTIERAFFSEFHNGQIKTITLTTGCSVLAAVGDNMARHPGVAGQFFTALGHSHVNVIAIAQGSSERNISVIVSGADARKALRAVHSSFFVAQQGISIGIIGPGNVGAALLEQLRRQLPILKRGENIDFDVRGIMNSEKMVLGEPCVNLESWPSDFSRSLEAVDIEKFMGHVSSGRYSHAAIIDATSGTFITSFYPEMLSRGIHVITANKTANSAPYAFYERVKKEARMAGAHFLYETNVGAGLPVIETLMDLIRTGDRVITVDGVLSGSMSFIFNSYDGRRPFSEVVKDAMAAGYTEPDPREDLSGIDVARKLVILSREMGYKTEIEDVFIESLVPDYLTEIPKKQYLDRMNQNDQHMLQRYREANATGGVLRYVARLTSNGRAEVRLMVYPRDHAFAGLKGSDNVISFQTERYDTHHLVIQGPGAGARVTAGGLFADLLRLAAYIGVKK